MKSLFTFLLLLISTTTFAQSNILESDTSACDSFEIETIGTWESYAWSTGDTTSSIIVQQTGTYWVMVTDSSLNSFIDTIQIIIHSSPVVNLGTDLKICEGDTTILSGFDSLAAFYLWSTGDTTSGISIIDSGTYYVTITNMFGCSSSDTIHIRYHPKPNANFTWENIGPGITLTAIFSIPTQAGCTYFWDFNDGAFSNVQNPVHQFNPDSLFFYACFPTITLTVTNMITGCQSKHSKEVSILCEGINDQYYKVSVYPNPASEKLHIEIEETFTQLEVKNVLGRTILLIENPIENIIDVSTLTKGVYYLSAITKEKQQYYASFAKE